VVQSTAQPQQTQPQATQGPTQPIFNPNVALQTQGLGGTPQIQQVGSDIERAKQTIADIESGGDYGAVGPETGKGKAYGKYQVMDFNIPSWTAEVLGESLTPEQFLVSPELQDRVFETKFQQFAQQYGGYENAAKVWFGGPGALTNPNAKDVLGTDVNSYANRFAANFSTEQPQQFNAIQTTPVQPKTSYIDEYQQQVDSALAQYGLDSSKIESGFQVAPAATLSELVQQVMDSVGLPDIRENVTKISDEIESIANERDREIEAIQDNPWKSAGSKSELIRKIEDRYEKKIANRTNKLTLLQDAYQTARQESQFAITTAVNLYDKQRTFDQNRLEDYLDRAEKVMESKKKLNEPLSVADAKALGVPYGTTAAQAYGLTPVSEGTIGEYTSKQLTALSKLNQNVSDSDSYKKTVNMRTYANSVEAALSQGNGIGDIAAINQFQKVIDEGAVTRDQDVRLIQGAQSYANQLKLQLKKLESGDQLSNEQRNQIRNTVNSLYDAQIKAIEKDPYILSKKREAELNRFREEDTVLGQLKGFTSAKQLTATQELDSILGGGTPSIETHPQSWFDSFLGIFGLTTK
jgi:hypothetical protein